jgi:endonuclease-3
MHSDKISKIIEILEKTYPDAECSLTFRNPFELMIATILSAQCTDARVNKVTPSLFAQFPDAQKMSKASQEEIEAIIQSTGFYRAKAKNIRGACKILTKEYGGKIPDTIEALVKLPGVGRKTANVILGNAFHKPAGLVVDTHVKRIAFRLGLTHQKTPEKIEQDLNGKIPERYWVLLPHWLIHHGRQICLARKPLCSECPVASLCSKNGLIALKAGQDG